jgi:hypothetical protein
LGDLLTVYCCAFFGVVTIVGRKLGRKKWRGWKEGENGGRGRTIFEVFGSDRCLQPSTLSIP